LHLYEQQLLKVVTHATVTEVVLDESKDPPRAVGVRYLREGQCESGTLISMPWAAAA
jgi:hypothetical protein